MRTWLRFLIFTAILSAFTFPIVAQEQPETLIWGVIPDYPPYTYINEEQELDGFIYHVISRILDDLGVDYRIHLENWDTMYPKLLQNELHVYAPFVQTPERLNTVYWPMQSVITSYTTIGTSQPGVFDSIEDLADRTFIVTQNDESSKNIFEQFMRNTRIPYELYEVPSASEAIKYLQDGAADGYIIDHFFTRSSEEVHSSGIALSPRIGYWTCSASAPMWIKNIVNEVSAELARLQDDPTSYYYEALNKHMPVASTGERIFPTWLLVLIGTLFTAVVVAIAIVYFLTSRLRNSADELRKAVEEKAIELTSVYEQLVQSEKMITLGEAVAGMAHEVSTPLGVAYTASTLLNSALVDEDSFYTVAQDALPVIVENLRRTGNLVQAFKQITIDQTSGEMRDIVLPTYVEQIWQGLSQKYLVYKNIDFNVSVKNERGEDIKVQVLTFPGALSRIFLHLFDNCVVHGFDAKPKRSTLQIHTSIVLRYLQDQLTYEVLVEDNGIGFPEEIHSKIMEPFFTTKTSDVAHPGLGLPSVYRSLEKSWNLKLWRIENRESGGVRVQFHIQSRTAKEQRIIILDK